MTVTVNDVRQALRTLDLAGEILCVHSSLRSFGSVADGARSIVQGLLAEDCTVMVPTFSMSAYAVAPPTQAELRPVQNGMHYDSRASIYLGADEIYTPASKAIDVWMGAIPATLLELPERIRGNHPLSSFTAVGSAAEVLIKDQKPLDVFAPLRRLAEQDGVIILMGVGLERMTFIHCAEELAGRRPFIRWANDTTGKPAPAAIGSCSDGFGQLASQLERWRRTMVVGRSEWQIFPARRILAELEDVIRERPGITHCDERACERCNDAARGGPIMVG